jgi:hypothetical protein
MPAAGKVPGGRSREALKRPRSPPWLLLSGARSSALVHAAARKTHCLVACDAGSAGCRGHREGWSSPCTQWTVGCRAILTGAVHGQIVA